VNLAIACKITSKVVEVEIPVPSDESKEETGVPSCVISPKSVRKTTRQPPVGCQPNLEEDGWFLLNFSDSSSYYSPGTKSFTNISETTRQRKVRFAALCSSFQGLYSNVLCPAGFVGDVMFSYNGLWRGDATAAASLQYRISLLSKVFASWCWLRPVNRLRSPLCKLDRQIVWCAISLFYQCSIARWTASLYSWVPAADWLSD